MKKIIILNLVFAVVLFAQEKRLSLEESLNIGLGNSKEIKISKSKLISSEEKITEVGSQMFPKLTLGAGYTNVNVVEPESFGLVPRNPAQIKNPFYSYGLNLSLQAPIFTGFQLSSLKGAAEFNNKAVQNDLQNTINQKALGIHTAYWNLYKAEKSVDLILQSLSSLRQKLKDTKQFLDNGLVTKNDLLKLKVQVSKAELKLIDAKNKQEVARALLNKTIGYPLSEQTKIKTDVMIDPISGYRYDELLSEALINRNELKSLGYRIDAGEEKITAANSGWWPKLYAVGSYYYYNINAETFNINDQNLQLWYLGLSLNWDLWDWGYTSSKSTQAEQEVLQGKEQMNLLKEQIELEVYNNYLSLISEKEKINISELAVESAGENYRLTGDKYNNQLATSTDLIIAQTELLDAKTQLAISIADYELAKTKLEIAVGRKVY
jgi:outer membrane protein